MVTIQHGLSHSTDTLATLRAKVEAQKQALEDTSRLQPPPPHPSGFYPLPEGELRDIQCSGSIDCA